MTQKQLRGRSNKTQPRCSYPTFMDSMDAYEETRRRLAKAESDRRAPSYPAVEGLIEFDGKRVRKEYYGWSASFDSKGFDISVRPNDEEVTRWSKEPLPTPETERARRLDMVETFRAEVTAIQDVVPGLRAFLATNNRKFSQDLKRVSL